MKCLCPRRDAAGLAAVLVNTAGGITSGDRFEIAAHVDAGTRLTLTSQTAERAYAAQPGEVGRLETRLDVGSGGRRDGIPQETILFDHSALRRRLTVKLAPSATALIAEPLVLGRAAMGEVVHRGRFDDRIEIRRDGRPLYQDAMRLDGDIADGWTGRMPAGARAPWSRWPISRPTPRRGSRRCAAPCPKPAAPA